ncbi:SGNH/GDSL hydrolase family protein [Tsukamurella paurometabola]|uniref:GDSL-like Lipase/Acylhydrolase n=1 Tax=Tsukamurella paurometabola TaxID=2061 RepID=A0A3P8KCN4_TSUPA|nr:SGNH/GDSL hydrolase family protein [Tsukamurella paurometabola]MBS4101765.1 SGNH/GDSL hydrolase family protein [Tsukamurella paurometabola]UEA84785.1 SGNH/GDSL hydrolase family protein [Tsukamurella paurometabola]VDR37368.1 GDSL-like Lipase/Acylhydrolase [Tsukamurella paurometabola]
MGYSRSRLARDALYTSAAAVSGAGATWGAYALLTKQARTARTVIPHRTDMAPSKDGIYSPGTTVVERPGPHVSADVSLMVFGDSTAAGLGVDDAEHTPGVLLARGVVAETGRTVRLAVKAIVGATSKGLAGQIEAAFIAKQIPDVAVIIVGANDVTALNSIEPSARRLGAAVAQLRGAGAEVVVGTCPDIGVVQAIPQPLRSVIRRYGLQLAARQRAHVLAAGGHPVPFADTLTPEFLDAPERMFSPDNFHPSAAGYELAARLLLPEVLAALGEWHGPLPSPPEVSEAADANRLTARLGRALRRG